MGARIALGPIGRRGDPAAFLFCPLGPPDAVAMRGLDLDGREVHFRGQRATQKDRADPNSPKPSGAIRFEFGR